VDSFIVRGSVAVRIGAVSLASAAAPILVSRAVDLLGDDLNLNAITLISGAVLLTGFIIWGANWLRRRLTSRAVGDMVMSLRLHQRLSPPHKDNYLSSILFPYPLSFLSC